MAREYLECPTIDTDFDTVEIEDEELEAIASDLDSYNHSRDTTINTEGW